MSETTGHQDIDDLVASVRDLDEVPVEDHVAVFEHAHERLRAALEARPEHSNPERPNPVPPGLRPEG